jgi:hypothetical protein
MRQRDVDQLVDIWTKDISFADPVELPGFEFAIGALVKPLAYATDPKHPLDLTALRALIEQCKDRQQVRRVVVRDCHADG